MALKYLSQLLDLLWHTLKHLSQGERYTPGPAPPLSHISPAPSTNKNRMLVISVTLQVGEDLEATALRVRGTGFLVKFYDKHNSHIPAFAVN